MALAAPGPGRGCRRQSEGNRLFPAVRADRSLLAARPQPNPEHDANCVTDVEFRPVVVPSKISRGDSGSRLGAGRIPDGRRMRYPPSRRDRPEKPLKEPENPTIPADRPLAIFCDFDGTFSVQDVGSSLAQKLLPEKRKQLWKRFEQGEFTAWTYAMALLDGLDLPEKELDRFLETIDLDPGARSLLDWCAEAKIPFRILSDGFDWNLERLQAMNQVRFDYQANHLEYEGTLWRLRAGRPNGACGCGTGSCKRGLIAAYRAQHPDAYCIHIGNGRVSDLCGALEADLAFAKDTLAPALEEVGRAYLPFDTLHDVVAVLSDRTGDTR